MASLLDLLWLLSFLLSGLPVGFSELLCSGAIETLSYLPFGSDLSLLMLDINNFICEVIYII
jgi:hypothetical protein